MNITRGAAGLVGLAMLLWTASIAIAQSEPEVRRARPVDEPPVRRAIPADESIDKVLRSLKDEVSEPSSRETEGAEQRQLEYANGLFARKLYDLAIPEYQKYLEARCLEALGKKDEAADIYSQVAEAPNPNPYREDSRVTAATIFAARGKKLDALKQYEALANEAQKPALKAECAVRGGLIALELVQADKGKMDKSTADRAAVLFQKGRSLPDAGKFRAIAQVGFRRLQFLTGQYAQLVADYKKELDKLPDAAQAEVLLLAANSQRRLGHPKEAVTV